jgi:hypothetical protein
MKYYPIPTQVGIQNQAQNQTSGLPIERLCQNVILRSEATKDPYIRACERVLLTAVRLRSE